MTEVCCGCASASFRYSVLSGILLVAASRSIRNIIGRYFFHSSISWRKKRCCSSCRDACSRQRHVACLAAISAMDVVVRLVHRKGREVLDLLSELDIFGCCGCALVFAWPTIRPTGGFRPAELGTNIPLAISQAMILSGSQSWRFMVARGITGRWRDPSPSSTIERVRGRVCGRTTDGGHFCISHSARDAFDSRTADIRRSFRNLHRHRAVAGLADRRHPDLYVREPR